jgi:hypothetical protein
MKKKILVLLLSVSSVMAMANPGDDITPAVRKSFEAKFGTSTSVSWKHIEDMYIGYFILDGQNTDAYFYDNGELLGTGRTIEKNKMDEKTKAAINKKFEGCWIQLVYELMLPNQASEHLLILGNIKFTAIVKVDQRGSVQVIQKQKNRLFMQENSPVELTINNPAE